MSVCNACASSLDISLCSYYSFMLPRSGLAHLSPPLTISFFYLLLISTPHIFIPKLIYPNTFHLVLPIFDTSLATMVLFGSILLDWDSGCLASYLNEFYYPSIGKFIYKSGYQSFNPTPLLNPGTQHIEENIFIIIIRS